MSLEPGSVLDHYTIVELLGQGGMGEVYRAQDTRVHRDVAIKVSHEAFSERFAREARVIAALNHPNICTLYDVGPNYLVMELVEGETLEDRVKQGALGEEEAVRIGHQIADALDYAHDKGVVHRDLKPANIKIRPDGVVKVLDFGLARVGVTESAPGNKDVQITMTMGATRVGSILGTPAYMAPEQATGRAADKRADIWAFGIVLYETLSGGRPFGGETLQESIAATLRDAPDLSKVPLRFRRLLSRCLEKDPQNRLKHIGDVMLLLEDSVAARPGVSATAGHGWLWPAIATVTLLAAAALAWLYLGSEAEKQEIVRLQFSPQSGVSPAPSGAFALSPDGRKIVFAGTDSEGTRYWLRSLDSLEARPLNEGKGAGQSPPFFSPDSRFVAFVRAGVLYKVDLTGGAPQEICRCSPLGGSWFGNGSGDSILLGLGPFGIERIPASGGTPAPVTKPDRSKSEQHYYPLLLPDGKHFFYLSVVTGVDVGTIKLGSLDAKPEDPGKTVELVSGNMIGWMASTSRILYESNDALYARAFDPDRASFTGEAVQVIPRVGRTPGIGFAHFAVSNNDTLVYRTGSDGPSQRLKWFDRSGKELGASGDPVNVSSLVLSPDGNRATLIIPDAKAPGGAGDVWVADLIAGTRTRLTASPRAELQAVWSPDGAWVAYNTTSKQRFAIYKAPSNGIGTEELVHAFEAGHGANLTHWSADGKRLLYQGNTGPQNQLDLWTVPAAGGGKPEMLIASGATKVAARFSPDGRYVAYRSGESGRNEAYVQSVPGAGAAPGKWVISRGGAAGMINWRKDGRELFYLAQDGGIMAVDVSTSGAFQSGAPHKLFDIPPGYRSTLASSTPGALASIAPDGQRFLFALPEEAQGEPFTVVLNWHP